MPEATAPITTEKSVRRSSIDRDDILNAALRLIGPNRSVSALSLREVAREAGIAPNSFYRHFRDMDELAIALIDMAGDSLRSIIREARLEVTGSDEVIRPSVEVFMRQLESDSALLHILLREGTVGSDAFRQAVEQVLKSFEDELREDLIRLAGDAVWREAYQPALVARAITRLVFTMGGTAMDMDAQGRRRVTEEVIEMVRMIIVGAHSMREESDA